MAIQKATYTYEALNNKVLRSGYQSSTPPGPGHPATGPGYHEIIVGDQINVRIAKLSEYEAGGTFYDNTLYVITNEDKNKILFFRLGSNPIAYEEGVILGYAKLNEANLL